MTDFIPRTLKEEKGGVTGTERLGKKKEEYECYPHVPRSSLMLILCHISVLLGAMETVTLRNQRK